MVLVTPFMALVAAAGVVPFPVLATGADLTTLARRLGNTPRIKSVLYNRGDVIAALVAHTNCKNLL
jgi:hypothetical protein